nr:lipoate--protein ligase [bacterium]
MVSRLLAFIGQEHDPYHNLALEACLMGRVQPGDCVMYLWQNQHTVVIGRNQDAFAQCNVDALEGDGGHLARRLSGGGAVYHDLGNLNFTFLAREGEYDVARQMNVIVSAARALGIRAEVSGRNDATVDGRKFSGNAFYKSGGVACHHGTLLIDCDTQQMAKYLRPSRLKLASKGVDSVRARVANLVEFCPGLSVQGMHQALKHAFEAEYGLGAHTLQMDEHAPQVIQKAQFFASDTWRLGQVAPCNWHVQGRFDWGEVSLALWQENGAIRQARLYSDSMEQEAIPLMAASLEGCPFSRQAMAMRLTEAVQGHDQWVPIARDIAALIEKSL